MIKQTEKLKSGLRNKVIRIALSKAASPVKEVAKNNIPTRTGTLSKSLRIKTKFYKNAAVWVAIIGAGRKVNGKKNLKNPSRYSGVMERGSKYARGYKYLTKAQQAKRSEFVRILQEKIKSQIDEILKA
mgnify:CR=1 FL=1